jgi:hypothetical protein
LRSNREKKKPKADKNKKKERKRNTPAASPFVSSPLIGKGSHGKNSPSSIAPVGLSLGIHAAPKSVLGDSAGQSYCPDYACAILLTERLRMACDTAWSNSRLSSPDGCCRQKDHLMRKILPDTMFTDPERSRLTMLRSWVLDHEVSEIEMTERQFWIFAQLQPVAEKPWTTFMGRVISVPDMPIEAQKQLGIFHKRTPGAI